MDELLFGTTLLASFLGGVVALLAPCCVSVMLPAYLASGLHRRGGILAATLVFAAGVATVILPIGLGAAALSALLREHHLLVFSIGGGLMLLVGIAMLAGWQAKLPMPSARGGGRGIGGVYLLGLFSGVASACCAPVLAGAVLLAGASGSFPAALTIGATYVAGMVAPLMLLSLLWERSDRARRILHGRQVRLPLLGVTRSLGMTLSALLLVAMGVLTIMLAISGPAPTTGWRLTVAADLQHLADTLTDALSWLPGWVFALALTAAAVLIARRVWRSRRIPQPPTTEEARIDGHEDQRQSEYQEN